MLQLKNTSDNFHIEKPKTDMFSTIHQQYVKVGHIQAPLSFAKCERGIKHSSTVHMLVLKELAPTSMSCVWESGRHFTMSNCISTIPSKFSILNLGTWLGRWNSATDLMHTPLGNATFYSLIRHSLPIM